MKKVLSLILALAMMLSMTGFAAAEQGAAVVVGIAGDPGNIGPFQGMGPGRIGILFTTYEFLVTKDGAEYPGVLMKELTPVDDLTYDVEIYDYIYDQDGNHLTASDIKFCYESAPAICPSSAPSKALRSSATMCAASTSPLWRRATCTPC